MRAWVSSLVRELKSHMPCGKKERKKERRKEGKKERKGRKEGRKEGRERKKEGKKEKERNEGRRKEDGPSISRDQPLEGCR